MERATLAYFSQMNYAQFTELLKVNLKFG